MRSGKYKLSVQHREYNFQEESFYEYLRIDDYTNKTSYFKYVSKIPLKFLYLLQIYHNLFDDLGVSLFEYQIQSAYGKRYESSFEWEMFDANPSFMVSSIYNGGLAYGKLALQNLALKTALGNKNHSREYYEIDINGESRVAQKKLYDSINSSIAKALKFIKHNDAKDITAIFQNNAKIVLDSLEFNKLKLVTEAIQKEVLSIETSKSYYSHAQSKFSGLCNPRENRWYEIYRIEPSNIPQKKRFKSNWIAKTGQEINSHNQKLQQTNIYNYTGINNVKNNIPLRIFFNRSNNEVIGFNLIETEKGKRILQFSSQIEENLTIKNDLLELLEVFPDLVFLTGFDLFQTSQNWGFRVSNSLNYAYDQLYSNSIIKTLNKNGFKKHQEIDEVDLENSVFLFDSEIGSILFEEISFLQGVYSKIPLLENKSKPSEIVTNTIDRFKTNLGNLISEGSKEPKNEFTSNFNRDTRDWCASGFFIGVTVSSDTSFQNMQVVGFNFRPKDFNGLVVNIGVNAIFNKYFNPD